MKISTIIDQIDLGSLALPVFQRGYVWNRDQVRRLMNSLYHRHPIGSLLVWETKASQVTVRGNSMNPSGRVLLLLDGQQRMTTLYGIIRGRAPQFFEGDSNAFTDLYFHLDDEKFAFYAPVKMSDNPAWIKVTELMQQGEGHFITKLMNAQNISQRYIDSLMKITNIRNIDLHVEHITGEDKTVDIVVQIFNDVNSGGTKLSKGDLALAKICASWEDARAELKSQLKHWHDAGFDFKMELLLRSITAITTGSAFFSALDAVESTQFRDGLLLTEKLTDTVLNMISSRLGLDHDRVIGSRYSFPVLVRYLQLRGGHLADYRERDTLLYWYVHTFLWGRYSGSTETVLSQDLKLIETADDGIDRLIAQMRKDRGDLVVRPDDYSGQTKGARFYPTLYMLTRVGHSRDFESGIELRDHLLGRNNQLEVHHIFPRALLYKHGYQQNMVNAIANFTFLTKETNLLISDRSPEKYLPEFEQKHPGVLSSHWIPTDPALWNIERYPDFLAERRKLLAQATNQFLDGLLHGTAEQTEELNPIAQAEFHTVVIGEDNPEFVDCNTWMVQQDLPEGEMNYELIDPNTGKVLTMLDLAWPNGIQEGYGQPVALLIDREDEAFDSASREGYMCFRNVADFKDYVESEIIGHA